MQKAIYPFLLIVIFQAAAWTSPALSQDYILGEGDVLTISVYDQPDLKSIVRISGDGMITLPLIGQVRAAGMTVGLLSKNIETLLADGYLVKPQVTIFIEEFRSLKVTILGGVRAPGLYELKGQTSLLELISKAGGLAETAGAEAIIRRHDAGLEEKQIINVDLQKLLEQGLLSENMAIMNGDNIYIPPKRVYYVTGEVKNSGEYVYLTGLTVLQALTKAGGLSGKAAPNRIKIIRSTDNIEQLLQNVRMDEAVQPNDVIVVPESYF